MRALRLPSMISSPKFGYLLLCALVGISASGSEAAESSFERLHRERAESLARDGRWFDAATEWEILFLLQPERAEYGRSLTEARSKAAEAAKQATVAANEARARGDLQNSVRLYLRALADDPADAEAARALREIEKDQISRGKTRPIARLPQSETNGSSSKPSKSVSATQRRELEAAVIVLHQGDYESSANMLEEYLRRYPNDDLATRALAEAYAQLAQQRLAQGKKEEALRYLQKVQSGKSGSSKELQKTIDALRKEVALDYEARGVRVESSDLNEAIRLWERALEYDPSLTRARARLEEGRRIQQKITTQQKGTKP